MQGSHEAPAVPPPEGSPERVQRMVQAEQEVTVSGGAGV